MSTIQLNHDSYKLIGNANRNPILFYVLGMIDYKNKIVLNIKTKTAMADKLNMQVHTIEKHMRGLKRMDIIANVSPAIYMLNPNIGFINYNSELINAWEGLNG